MKKIALLLVVLMSMGLNTNAQTAQTRKNGTRQTTTARKPAQTKPTAKQTSIYSFKFNGIKTLVDEKVKENKKVETAFHLFDVEGKPAAIMMTTTGKDGKESKRSFLLMKQAYYDGDGNILFASEDGMRTFKISYTPFFEVVSISMVSASFDNIDEMQFYVTDKEDDILSGDTKYLNAKENYDGLLKNVKTNKLRCYTCQKAK